MSSVKITRKDGGPKVKFIAKVEGIDGQGVLTMAPVSDTLYIADHTGVPKNMGGNGVGSKLVEFLVKDAREKGYKVIPQCPFIDDKWKDHPEWSDVFVKRP